MWLMEEEIEKPKGGGVTEIVYKEESYRIIGACFEVYNEMGFGFSEPVYQECTEIELEMCEIPFYARKSYPLFYKERKLKKEYEPDIVCFEKIVVELKAVSNLTDEHRAQLINYLRGMRMKLGLLVNYGRPGGLQHERIVL